MARRRGKSICTWPSCTNPAAGPRCQPHELQHQLERNADPHRLELYGGDWPRRAREEIARHRAAHGDVCPGWGRDAHAIAAEDWTCDHDVGPLCRSCNGRKAVVVDRPERSEG